MNYYEILQVRNDASPEVIRAAYKVLIKQFHPDKHVGETGNAEMAKVLTAAYNTLSKPRLRAEYDERVDRSAVKGLVTRGAMMLRTSLVLREVQRPRISGPVVLTAGVLCLAIATMAGALLDWRKRTITERENVSLLLKQSPALPAQDTRVITLFQDRLVLTWPKDDPYVASQVVVIPEIRVEIARPRLEEFRAYIEANRDGVAKALAADLPNFLRGFRLDPEGSGGFLLARAMHRSFNQLHPDAVHNLCPPDAARAPVDCSGIVRIFFPKSFWISSAKD